jgi:toxin ParE1/3/4
MYTVTHRPETELDLREAANWYNDKRDGLGDEFLSAFWSRIADIVERPLSFGISSKNVRACSLSRFPYVIYFKVTGFDVLIVAVMHGGRSSIAWIDRVNR